MSWARKKCYNLEGSSDCVWRKYMYDTDLDRIHFIVPDNVCVLGGGGGGGGVEGGSELKSTIFSLQNHALWVLIRSALWGAEG